MSTIPMTSPVTPRQPSIPSHHNGSPKKMRFSLSSLQSPSSNGTAHLTQRDIEALRRKGLPIAIGAEQSSVATNKSQPSHPSTIGSSRSTTPPLKVIPTTPIITAEQTFCSKPPLPISARVAPLTTSKSKNTKGVSKHKTSKGDENSNMIIHFKERPLPAYHHGIIEDTCSHLHTSANNRRHSDSSSSLSLVSLTAKHPIPEDTLALDSIRRASIATTSPVIPSPLGGRTVLYKASYAHTLLSLPSRSAAVAVATPSHESDHIMNPIPTPEMNNFKFPAEESTSNAPSSPAMKPTMSPTIPHRSKRKSSIPMRSPTWNNVQDPSPGVVFRLPFGTPPLPSAPFRRANTPSAQTTSPMNPLEEEGSVGGSTPPTSYPSPASSSRAPSASGPSSVSEAHDQQSIHFETPPSPASRSGLGIQVQESFSEPGATHPLESTSLLPSAIIAKQSEPITFREEDSSISIGDIIVAEQASAAQRQASQLADTVETAENNAAETISMPTPPLTTRVLSMRIMEPSSERHESPRDTRIECSSAASPPTPFTPNPAFQSSNQTRERAHESSNSLSQISFDLLSVSHETQVKNQDDDVPNPTMELDQDSNSTCSQPNSTGESNFEKEEDPSVLPLWAQRQNHIRRQSLIPRPELDFVKGSGILPPANRSLVTIGGAKILSYPVLISDMVHVALDELQAKGMALDGSDISEESEEDPEHVQHSAPKGAPKLGARAARNANIKVTNSKRKKGGNNAGKRRGSTLGNKSLAHSQGDEEFHSGEEYQEDLDGANEQENQRYMSSQFKRRRISILKQNGNEAESSSSSRSTSERHGSSSHRRWGSNNTQHSASPSTSPNINVSSFREGNRLGSPVELDGSYTYGNYMGDEGDAIMEEDGVVDIDDDNDSHHYRRFQDRQDYSHKGQHNSNRRSYVPEHLRIPASEVDIAVQLTKEMMESAKKRPHKKEKFRAQHSQHLTNQTSKPSLKTLKPLLDATMKAEGGRHRVDDDDENDNNNEDEYDIENHDIAKVGGSPSKKSPKSTDPNGAVPKKASKPKEGKMSTKRCEACGASETPCWRPGYTAHSALCNSCGLRYKKSNVFCAKVGCKYIPLKTEYAAMEAERLKAGRAHLLCHKCKGPVALPVPKE